MEEDADPNLPILLAEAVTAESFNPALFAALASPNLNVAAQRIAAYKKPVPWGAAPPRARRGPRRHDFVD